MRTLIVSSLFFYDLLDKRNLGDECLPNEKVTYRIEARKDFLLLRLHPDKLSPFILTHWQRCNSKFLRVEHNKNESKNEVRSITLYTWRR